MKNQHDFEAMLAEALHRRGAPAPFSIDVTRRVMARVAAYGPAPRKEMNLRQLGRWAAAASVAGAALAAGIAWQGPGLAEATASSGHAISTAISTSLKLLAPVATLVTTCWRVLLALFVSARTVVQTLEPLQPLAQLSLAATTVAMLIVTALIVGRDVRSHAVEKERA